MYDRELAVQMVKTRLDMMHAMRERDEYITARVDAAAAELEAYGIHLREEDPQDLMLLIDQTVWEYGSRDKTGEMPEWLAKRRRDRWARETEAATDDP